MVNSRTVSAVVTAKVNKQDTDLCSRVVNENPCPLHGHQSKEIFQCCLISKEGVFNLDTDEEGTPKHILYKIEHLIQNTAVSLSIHCFTLENQK